MEITYTKQGDYLLPDLTFKETKKGNINKYGRMRLAYLKEYKKALYTSLLMKEEINNHLISVSKNSYVGKSPILQICIDFINVYYVILTIIQLP